MKKINITLLLLWHNIINYIREPFSIFWLFIFPILQLLLLSYFFEKDKQYSIAILDKDKTLISRNYIQYFISSGIFDINDLEAMYENKDSELLFNEYQDLLAKRKIRAIVLIPQYFENNLNLRKAKIELYFNEEDLQTNLILRTIIREISQTFANDYFLEISPIEIKNDFMKEKIAKTAEGKVIPLKYPQFLLPGIIGLTLLSVGIYSVGVSLVVMRANNYLKYIGLYPITKSFYLGTMLTSGFIISLIITLILMVVAYIVFDVNILIKENFIYLTFLILLGIYSFMSIGIFLSAISKTVNHAAIMANIIFFPLMLLSEVYFTLPNLPLNLNFLMMVNPLYIFIQLLRKILFNQNIELYIILDEFVMLLSLSLFLNVLSFKYFSWNSKE